jgi:GAF domain-containing protein
MSHPVAEEAPAVHGDALNMLRAAIAEAADPRDAAQRAVEVLHDRFPHYDWVGVYWVDGSDLALGPWVGPEPTEHTRIPIGSGICGAAAASGQTEIVPDVDADPRYLACFASTKSEIVVPIFADGSVVGEIDIDGSDPNAFDETDARFLEEVAALLAPLRPRT